MKKTMILFLVVCMLLCLIPSVGMLVAPTTKSSENKPMAEPPKLQTDSGGFNKAIFQEFETWFTQRMALRNTMVYADAAIQSTVFQQSSVSGVIRGTDGWLYYTDTLDDYLGTAVLSERELSNLAHNFGLIQRYLQQKNVGFLLTIAPNKNTLYGENMPYYDSVVVSQDHSARLLKPYLEKEGVKYLDLFQLFEEQEEVLYQKRDSHWNGKGAYLVYTKMMETMDLLPVKFSNPRLEESRNGDLNRMLYSFYGQPEEDYVYDTPGAYTGGEDVESGWIVTENSQKTGTLLMFRDSFANNLIPFFSENFGTACYSKAQPNFLESYVEQYTPGVVMIQKVERNITDYLNDPPILTPPESQLPDNIIIAETATTVKLENSANDMRYVKISGVVDDSRRQEEDRILVRVADRYYEAFHTGRDGYVLYLKKEQLTEPQVKLQVYLVNGNSCIQAVSAQVDVPQT